MFEGKTISFNKSDMCIYFILFPFMYPRGFSEYFSGYKMIFTLWLYGVVGIIFMYFIFKLFRGCNKYKECTPLVLLYFGYFAFVTFMVQGGISQGIQKVFVTPALCLFGIICLRQKIIQFIRCLAVILIFNFTLNITLFSPWTCSQFFNVDEHLIFLGHVQVAAQLGILGIFVGYLCKRYVGKLLGYTLIILSIMTMLMSDTAAAKISLILFVTFFIMDKIKSLSWIIYLDSKYYIFFWLLLNVALLIFYKILNGTYVIAGIDLTLSGRVFVWKSAIEAICNSCVLGYGAYGVLIKVFWNEWQGTGGMNYTHNEVLQRLLDGGIILLLLFILLLCFFVKNMKNIKDKKLRAISNICLIIILIIMLVESVTEYYYIFILFILFAYVENIERN